MLKVIIAETDIENMHFIENVITSKLKELKIVARAKSGNELVIDTINQEPDIIVTGIRIAGVNGIEAIRQIRNFNKTVRVVIVSAYDYFEFARESMVLGVSDYLIQPITEENMVESIRHIIDQIHDDVERVKKFRREEHLLYDALRYVEASFMYSIFYGGKFTYDIKQYCELLDIEEIGYIMYIELSTLFINLQTRQDKLMERLYRRIKSIINVRAKCVVGENIMNRIMVYVSCDPQKNVKEYQIEAIRLAKQIVKGLKDTFGMDVYIGIGSMKSLELIHESYFEAVRCAKFKGEGPIIHSKEVRLKPTMLYDYMEETKKLVEVVRYNKHEASNQFLTILELLRPLDSTERIFKIIEVLMLVDFEVRKDGKATELTFNFVNEWEMMKDCVIEEQEGWAWRRFYAIIKLLRQEKSDRKTTVISVALEYIERHYNEEITLNEISEYVNLSPQHFSKIFKEATNYNFVEWVNNLRISKAKELMNSSGYTIKEICFQVGYQDPNYFSRIFKKYVGVTPTEYMKERAD